MNADAVAVLPRASPVERIDEAESLYVSAALDLHDGPLQRLVWCRHVLRGTRAQGGRLAEVERAVSEALDDVREVIARLAATSDAEAALEDLLYDEAETVARRHGTRVRLDFTLDVAPDAAVTRNAFRIVQEAITNAVRHGGAGVVDVRVRAGRERLRIRVEDDGRGFDPVDALRRQEGVGLRGMQTRAALLGGWVRVQSAPGGPTRVALDLPLRAADA